MNGAVHPASIAISIAMGASLLGGAFSVLVAMRSYKPRDAAVSILCGVACFLIVLNAIAAALIAIQGLAYVGLLKAALLQTAGFAVVGILFGLMRGLRSGRVIKTRSA